MTGEVLLTREAYGQTLVELGKEDETIVVCEADIGKSTKTCMFGNAFPKRYINAGSRSRT